MGRPLRALIVEDEALIALSLEAELKRAGYEVCRSVATGEEAVSVAKSEELSVILMDILLAGEISGIDAAKQIRAERSIPIIFSTGYLDSEIHQRALALEPLGYLRKPIDARQLTRLLESIDT